MMLQPFKMEKDKMGRGQEAPEGHILGLPALPLLLEVPSMHCETRCWPTGGSITALCARKALAAGQTQSVIGSEGFINSVRC